MVNGQINKSSISFVSPPTSAQLFAPGIVSTSFNERDLAISPDHQEIMYTLGTNDNSFRAIVQIKMKDGKVVQKEIAPFSGRYSDIEPFYAPDGRNLYFSSTRPLHENDSTPDYNIWFVEKISGEWSTEAKPVSVVLNSEADEFYPSVASNGNLYFTAAYPSAKGREDIYVTTYENGEYSLPVSLDTNINSVKYEFNAYISPKEDVLVFTSYGRPDDMGGGDLYISTRNASGQWTKARHAGPAINSPQLDYCPFIDFKASVFYFTSNRPPAITGKMNLTDFEKMLNSPTNGIGNIYSISLGQLMPK
jgi:Tol biopolymer transport system component